MKGYYPSTGFRDSIIMTDGSAGICKYIGTALSGVSFQPLIPELARPLAIRELLPSAAPKPSLHGFLCATPTPRLCLHHTTFLFAGHFSCVSSHVG